MSQFIEMFGEEQKISLGKICLIQKGATITRNEVTIGSIPVVAGGQEPSCYHNEANRNANMITISASGAYAGYVNYWEIPIFASDCNTISPKDTKQLDIIFLYNGLKAMQKEIYSLQKGGAQPHVYGKDLHNLLFPFPPFEHQQEFSDIVKQADKSKFIGFKSQFIEMFENKGYDTKELRTLIVKSFPGEWGVDDNDGSGVKVIRTTNITNEDKLELSEVVVRSIAQPKLDKKKLVKGDILLERSGGTKDYPVGRVAYFESEDIYVVNNFTQTLRCTNRVESKYLFYFLFFYYKLNKMKIRSMGNQTTGIQNLNMDEYMQIPVIIPPIEAQKQFLHIVEQADKSKYIN